LRSTRKSMCFLIVIAVAALFCSCIRNDAVSGTALPDGTFVAIEGIHFRPGEVLSTADSLEHAQRIAQAYNIRLFSFSNGIAVFGTHNPVAAITHSQIMRQEMSIAADIPELSLNAIYRPQDTGVGVANVRQQWHHSTINSELAWSITTGEGVLIAVIDTGIDITHPALRYRISPRSFNSHSLRIGIQYVQDDDGHGTHVAGIIAASARGGTVAGVAPGAELLVIKANSPGAGYFERASWLRGVNYAVENGARIINLSLGRHHHSGPDPNEHSVLRTAVNAGVVIIAAAGNDGYRRANFPAAYPEVIAVSALQEPGVFDGRFSNSNFGPEIALAAPGGQIYSTLPASRTGNKSGTSMAAPAVAGAAALVLSRNPGLTPQQVREVLTGTARRTTAWNSNLYGYGIVNVHAALLRLGTPPPVQAPIPLPPTPVPTPRPSPTPAPSNFVHVQGGTFQMGTPRGGNRNERPVRSVTVSGFYMSPHPVTQREWFEVMGTNPSRFRGYSRPVEQVSWFDAVEFANRKSLRAQLTPAYTITGSGANRVVSWNRAANGYRLPTEAEWEFAARGGTLYRSNFAFSGHNDLAEVAWHSRNSDRGTQDVGQLQPNSLGLYDMSGNVWEWVWDRYGSYTRGAQMDPEGASSGTLRVRRGGSWGDVAAHVRLTARGRFLPSSQNDSTGFRLVRS